MEFIPYQDNDQKNNRRCCYLSKINDKKSVPTKHGPEYFPVLVEIFKDFNPDMIIELGTHMGGATLVFHEAMLDIEIHTFDKVELIDLELFDRNKVFFHKEDLLSEENETLVNLLKENKDKKKILYCDNGNKEKELELYGPYLYSGDLIGCHDWKVGGVNPDVVFPIMERNGFVYSEYNELFREKKLYSRFWFKYGG